MKSTSLVKLLLYLMIVCNVYAFAVVLVTGSLDTSYPGYYLEDPVFAIVSLFLVLGFYLFTFFVFQFSRKLKNQIIIDDGLNRPAGLKKLTFIVAGFQLIYLYAILVEGAGAAGGVASGSQTALSSFFALFRADDFTLLFLLVFFTPLLFKINLALYFISFLLRGWLGVLISALIVVVYRYKVKVGFWRVFSVVVFALLVMSIFPFLMSVRNDLRLSDDYLLTLALMDFSDYWEVDLIAGLHGVLMRFQQIESLVYFLQNIQIFQDLYDKQLITPVYFDGPLLSGLYKQFLNVDSQPLGLVLADQSRELVFGRKTAVSPGLITYFLLDFASAFYIFLVPFVYGYATTFFARNSAVTVACFYFSTFYFSFGWSNAVLGSIVSIVVFILMSIFFVGLRRC